MTANRRKFSRYCGEDSYRKLFLISREGAITEPEYFKYLKKFNSSIEIYPIPAKGGKSAPKYVLKEIAKQSNRISLKHGDELWLAVDKDRWTDAQIDDLVKWVNEADSTIYRGLALSNPKFELWLLLHFEDMQGTISSGECSSRLGRYLPDYSKSLDMTRFDLDMIRNAIYRAETKDFPPCTNWPGRTGSTVYKLVRRILS